jgi:hypothetical protein
MPYARSKANEGAMMYSASSISTAKKIRAPIYTIDDIDIETVKMIFSAIQRAVISSRTVAAIFAPHANLLSIRYTSAFPSNRLLGASAPACSYKTSRPFANLGF